MQHTKACLSRLSNPPSKAVPIPGQVVIIFSKCSTPKPALLLTYLLITMKSSISHCFNITGWRKYAHQRIKFSTVVKLLCISIHTPHLNYLSWLLPDIWGGPKNPRWRRGCAHAPPSGKIFKFYPLVGVFAPPSNVKTMGNRGLHSY